SIVYTRWGRDDCPANSQTVYSGYAGGSLYDHTGAASDYLCLPPDPEWGLHTESEDNSRALVYGAEYQFDSLTDSRKSLHDQDVPCAVCRVKDRSSVIQIPARKTCYAGWNKEYTGYLMAGAHGHKAASQFVCLDENSVGIGGTQVNNNGKLFYPAEGRCGSLLCPPYVKGRELTCVVCSYWVDISGIAGGSSYFDTGAAADPLCLPSDPEWGLYTDTEDSIRAYVYGAEYQFHTLTDSRKKVHDYDVPCAVCRVMGRSTVITIPARKSCYPGWNQEYTGYLMAGLTTHKAASQYTCMDENPIGIPGSQGNNNAYTFYPVEGRCGSLPCPPYVNGRELTCVVCSI
ncbi:hypothetical protein FSP39_021864, partial [Pinctada imbricata]